MLTRDIAMENETPRTPNKQRACEMAAELLVSGYVLRSEEIAKIMVDNGYSPNSTRSYAGIFLGHPIPTKILESLGVHLAVTSYKSRALFYDGNLDLMQDTDIAEVKDTIDSKIRSVSEIA